MTDDKNMKNEDEEVQSLDDMMANSVDESDKPQSEVENAPAIEETTIVEETDETDKTNKETSEEESPEEKTSTEEPAKDSMTDDTTATEDKPQDDTNEDKTPIAKVRRGKWYIVHTYSGHENKVARTLMQRVQAMGFEERIFDALVPTRDTIRVRGGKKETIKEKIFPGYILVNMELSDEAWVLVRTTPGVTSFVGAQNKPTPIRDDEVDAIVAFVGQKDPIYKAQFSNGEAVKITDGPFSDFLGTIESIDEAKGKVKVLVSIFGRETPVELDFLQVAKI